MKSKHKKEIWSHPTLRVRRTFGQRASDKLTEVVGSWAFILSFLIIVVLWVSLNSYFLLNYGKKLFDPFPFILLNLTLSLLAAIQAPLILMTQNRQAQKDRIRAEYDYAVNRKAEREIEQIQKQLDRIEKKLSNK